MCKFEEDYWNRPRVALVTKYWIRHEGFSGRNSLDIGCGDGSNLFGKMIGMSVIGFFIIGLPGSTFELDKKSIEFAKKIGVDAMWGNLVPYPGTEVWDWVQENGTILMDWKEGFHFGLEPKIVFDILREMKDLWLEIYAK